MLHNRRESSWLRADSHVQTTVLTLSELAFTVNLSPLVHANGNVCSLLFLVNIYKKRGMNYGREWKYSSSFSVPTALRGGK